MAMTQRSTVGLVAALLGALMAAPTGLAAQDPVQCDYCDEPERIGGTFYCVLTVQEVPCIKGAVPNPLTCLRCLPEIEDEQQLEASVTVLADGTLDAPGTPLHGVAREWLALVTRSLEDDRVAVPWRCGREILLTLTDSPRVAEADAGIPVGG